MTVSIKMLLAAGAVGAILTAGSTAIAEEGASVTAGRAVAQRYCATCHAVAGGESPLGDAPPFAHLQFRYGAGGLAELLEKGMIKDRPRSLDPGVRLLHPRMPAFPLTDDEVVALADYLRTFETPADNDGPSPGR